MRRLIFNAMPLKASPASLWARAELFALGLGAAAALVSGAILVGAAALLAEPGGFLAALAALRPLFFLALAAALAALGASLAILRAALDPLRGLAEALAGVAAEPAPRPLALRADGEVGAILASVNQVIARHFSALTRMHRIAYVDANTNLPNEESFAQEVERRLRSACAADAGAVLVIELRRLAEIVQSLSADEARTVMRIIAARLVRLAEACRVSPRMGDDDALVIAFLGGASFALYEPRAFGAPDCARFARRLASALNQPFTWRGHMLALNAVCGAARAADTVKSASGLVREARLALSAARHAPARARLYTGALERNAAARLIMEDQMRAGLERHEFQAFFQGKVDLATGAIAGAEALARWVRPDKTIVSPNRFIPFAEECGLIVELSEAIMRQACWKSAAWRRDGMSARISVNVAAEQLRNERFPRAVLDLIDRAGLPAQLLELEITETVALEDIERTNRLLAPLRAAGVRIAIDDFGCGYSNFAALARLPIDVLKIDQGFVHALGPDGARAAAIIETILALARALDLETVAEGVERTDQALFLAERGCRYAQGFLYGAAVPPGEFIAALRRSAGADGAVVRAA